MNINSILSHGIHYVGLGVIIANAITCCVFIGVMLSRHLWISVALMLLVAVFTILNALALRKYFNYQKRETENFTICPIDDY